MRREDYQTFQRGTVRGAQERLQKAERPVDVNAAIVPVMSLVRGEKRRLAVEDVNFGAAEEALARYEDLKRLTLLHRHMAITDLFAMMHMREAAHDILLQAEYLFGIRE